MEFGFNNIYKNLDKFIKNSVIDLREVSFCEPCFIGMIFLLAIEYKNNPNKNLFCRPRKILRNI